MNETTLYPNWKDQVVYGVDGPQPHILMANEKVKALMAGLAPGAKIPEHAEAQSLYHFLEGTGWMTVDGKRLPVSAGPDGCLQSGRDGGFTLHQLVELAADDVGR